MEQAIKKAIEGGYFEKNGYCQVGGQSIAICFPGTDRIDTYISKEAILLDPLFWQALAKAEGWGMWKSPDINASVIEEDYWGESTPLWKVSWHRFIDHLAEGDTPDEFFNNLLTK